MSTTVSSPQACSVGGQQVHRLGDREGHGLVGEDAVGVELATHRVLARGQVDGDDVRRSRTAPRASRRAQSGRPGRAPMPRMPSSTTSASPSPLGSVVSTTPGRLGGRAGPLVRRGRGAPRRRSSRPRRGGPRHTARRRRCCRGRRGPRRPSPSRSSSRAAATPASPSTARAISSPSSRVAIGARLGGVDGIRRPGLDHGPGSLRDDDGRRDAGVVGQGQVERGDAEGVDPGLHGAAHLEVRAAVGAAVHLGVVPVHARPGRRAPWRGPPWPRTAPPASSAAGRARPSVKSRSRSAGVRSRVAPKRATSTTSMPTPTITRAPHQCTRSLDRDRLREVARLVDVEALGRATGAARRPAAARRRAAARAAASTAGCG